MSGSTIRKVAAFFLRLESSTQQTAAPQSRAVAEEPSQPPASGFVLLPPPPPRIPREQDVAELGLDPDSHVHLRMSGQQRAALGLHPTFSLLMSLADDKRTVGEIAQALPLTYFETEMLIDDLMEAGLLDLTFS